MDLEGRTAVVTGAPPARAAAELAGMSEEARAATPAPIPLEEVADAVVACIRDDRLAGRVMVLWRGEPRRLLDPGRRK